MKLTWTTFKPGGRRFYYVQWVNPATGRKETRSTKETNKRAADDFARKLVEEIELTGNATGRTSWASFIEDHAAECQPVMPAKTAALYRTAFNSLSKAVRPRVLTDINARSLSKWAGVMRADDKSEETVRCYFAHLRKALKWAKRQGMVPEVPDFPEVRKKRGQRRAKGRAVTGEEFERMLAAVEPEILAGKGKGKGRGDVARERLPEAVASLQRLLRGLWLGGLRLNETLRLRDGGDRGIRVDLDRPVPMLLIEWTDEKGARDRVLPLTPDFTAYLRTIRPSKPGGVFFAVTGIRGDVTDPQEISAVISRIGERAGVKVRDKGDGVKWASAQDLRRSFATRWAARLDKPRDLQVLMRHSDMKTTLGYYVFDEAEEMAGRIASAYRAADANTLANTGPDDLIPPQQVRHKSKQGRGL